MDFLKLQQEIMKDAIARDDGYKVDFNHRIGFRPRFGETWLIFNKCLFAIVPDERVYLDKARCFDKAPLTEEACTTMSKGAAFKYVLVDTGNMIRTNISNGVSRRILQNSVTGEEIHISEKYYKLFKANKVEFTLMGTDRKNMVYFFHEGHLVGGILPIIYKRDGGAQNDE